MNTYTFKVEEQLKATIPTKSDNDKLGDLEELLSSIRDKNIEHPYLEDFLDDVHIAVKKLMNNSKNPERIKATYPKYFY